MIASLRGKVIDIDGATATVEVMGVGYQVFCTRSCFASFELGSDVFIIVFTEVKEDLIRLYGFADKLEKQVFLLLTLVKGIGPKSALDVLSRIDAKQLLKMIGSGDISGLQNVKGVGKKTAERVIVELKDKVAAFALEQHGLASEITVSTGIEGPYDDALMALQALGFTKKDAEKALSEVQKTGVPLTDSGVIVREALRFI